MKTHILKIEEHFAWRILAGEKTYEITKGDCDFQKGDMIEFKIDSSENSGMRLKIYEITHVLRGGQYGIEQGYVVLSIKPFVSDVTNIQSKSFSPTKL